MELVHFKNYRNIFKDIDFRPANVTDQFQLANIAVNTTDKF